ncbi:MAG TPA: type II secretion system F family protein [Lacunisphaera sp.]|nr:type II secretion system F family protein [Lacunisphaera sp.]
MPRYSYIAINARGAEKSGLVDAPDVKQAAAHLRAQGLFPTAVEPAGERTAKPGRMSGPSLAWFGRPVRTRELAAFTRQLGTLLRAGMPLLRSLEVLARQERNHRFREVIESVSADISSGSTLSDALEKHPRIFDRLYLNMIKAGEAGGVLHTVLDRLARFQEKSLKLRGKLTAAMVYPVIVLGVALAILCGLLVFVVPRFQQIFADLLKGAPLPPLTQAVLAASNLVRHNLPLSVGLAVAAWLAFGYFRRTAAGARFVDTLSVKLPLFGELVLKAVIARFSRTLGTLLSSGVPILPALVISRETCGNARVSAALGEVHDRVKEGAPVVRPLQATAVFPPMVVSMVEVGEHAGQLPEMFNQIAEIYEEEVDNAVAGIGALIEPLLILILALVVGTIVIALFLPIIRIVQLLT